MLDKELSWMDAEHMCQNVSSTVAHYDTDEVIDDIVALLRRHPQLYVHPAMVFLQPKKKVIHEFQNNLTKMF